MSRRSLIRQSTGAAIGIMAAARLGQTGLVGAQTTLPEDAAPAEEQVLRVMGREGRYLDWSKSVQQRQFESALITEPLVRQDENYELQPAAATSWDISEDGLTWTFHLREGMVWSDGTPVTANDYVFTLRRMASPENAFDVVFYYASIKNFAEANAGEVPVEEVGIEALDDLTVAITTSQPTPFLGLISSDIYVIPPHIVEVEGDNWSLSPETCLSCGPFKLQEWDKGRQLVFVNNPDYNGPWASPLQSITYLIGDDAAQFPAYQNGEIDLIDRGYEQIISPADQMYIEGDATLSEELHTFPQFQTWWLAFGGEDTAFADIKVRQAFAHAVDKDALVASVLRGQAVAAYGLLPPGFHSANPERLKDLVVYDPELAKQELADAGFPDGEGFPSYDLFLRDPSPTVQTVAQAIQAMLKENLGIEVGIQSLERGIFTERNNAHELPFVLIPWDMDYYDASNFMGVYVTGGRHAWSNAEYDTLVREADGIVGDEAKRAELYQQAEDILVTDVGAVFLWNPIFMQLWKSYLTGPRLHENKFGILSWQAPQSGPHYYTNYVSNEKNS
ncbi:MAG: peptide ABC transporter substrate-binding protein [Thermomicrobiales bacterium]|nr:peptide ABC transporter substrate-binding protein [Thermomicrobiales bacterium]